MVAYSFKKRFVEPIRWGLGLGLDLSDGCVRIGEPKRQTIRAVGKRRHARPGETLQLYTAMRTKQCEKIGLARCTSCDPIFINVFDTHLEFLRFAPEPVGLDAFARADGFENAAEMHAFWAKEHGLGWFKGVLIKWVPL